MSDGYVEALSDALNNSDPDLWDRQSVERQVLDARNHLSTLQKKPPSERGNNFFRYKYMLEQLIKAVQDKLDGDSTYGTFTPALCTSNAAMNPYLIAEE